MNEVYVSFEIAKLLKEKGFDWKVFTFYDETHKFNRANTVYNWNNENFDVDVFSAPTQQMALRWLKEEKGMYISVVPDFNEYGEYPDDLYWFARVYDLRNGDYIHSTKLCKSSQEAFEAALEYVLTNLI